MTNNIQIQITKPFGPSIAKVKMPLELINKLNNYIDSVIDNETKYKNLDYGNKLAGNVKQEFKLENDFVEESRFLEFLLLSTKNWIKLSGLPEIKKFELLSSWAVRQFKNEYNPVHTHSGHVSGVGYLKVPNNLGATVQDNKKVNPNGTLELMLAYGVSETNFVLAKFLFLTIVLVLMIVGSLPAVVSLLIFSEPDLGPILGGYLGLTLLGLAFFSIGLLSSVISKFQIVSAVIAWFLLLLLWFVDYFSVFAEGWLRELVIKLSFSSNYIDLIRGIFDLSSCIYFLSICVVSILFCLKILTFRRKIGRIIA